MADQVLLHSEEALLYHEMLRKTMQTAITRTQAYKWRNEVDSNTVWDAIADKFHLKQHESEHYKKDNIKSNSSPITRKAKNYEKLTNRKQSLESTSAKNENISRSEHTDKMFNIVIQTDTPTQPQSSRECDPSSRSLGFSLSSPSLLPREHIVNEPNGSMSHSKSAQDLLDSSSDRHCIQHPVIKRQASTIMHHEKLPIPIPSRTTALLKDLRRNYTSSLLARVSHPNLPSIYNKSMNSKNQYIKDPTSLIDGNDTPRTRFSKQRMWSHKRNIEVLDKLDHASISRIQMAFQACCNEEGAKLREVFALTSCFESGTTDFQRETEHLQRVFESFDVDGDKRMNMDEITSFLVDVAKASYQQLFNDGLSYAKYEVMPVLINEDRCNYSFLRYFPSMNCYVVFEYRHHRFQLYDEHFHLLDIVRGHQGALLAAEYLPAHRLLVTSAMDQTLRFWTINAFKTKQGVIELSPIEMLSVWRTPSVVQSMCWIKSRLWTGDFSGRIVVWSIDTGRARSRMLDHKATINALLPLHDANIVASASDDSTVRLWDASTFSCLAILQHHILPVKYLASTQQLLFSGGADEFIMLYSVRTRSTIGKYMLNDNITKCRIEDCAGIDAIGDELVVVCSSGRVRIYDLLTSPTAKVLQEFSIFEDADVPKIRLQKPSPILTIRPALSTDRGDEHEAVFINRSTRGVVIAIASNMYVHRYCREDDTWKHMAHDQPIVFCSADLQSCRIWSLAVNGELKLWSLITGRLRHRTQVADIKVSVTCACMDANRRALFVAFSTGVIARYSGNGSFICNLFTLPHAAHTIHTIEPTDGTHSALKLIIAGGSFVGIFFADRIRPEQCIHWQSLPTKAISAVVIASYMNLVAASTMNFVYIYHSDLSGLETQKIAVDDCQELCFLQPHRIMCAATGDRLLFYDVTVYEHFALYSLSLYGDRLTTLMWRNERSILFCGTEQGEARAFSVNIYELLAMSKNQRAVTAPIAECVAVSGALHIGALSSFAYVPCTLPHAIHNEANTNNISGECEILDKDAILTAGTDGFAYLLAADNFEVIGTLKQAYGETEGQTQSSSHWQFHPPLAQLRMLDEYHANELHNSMALINNKQKKFAITAVAKSAPNHLSTERTQTCHGTRRYLSASIRSLRKEISLLVNETNMH